MSLSTSGRTWEDAASPAAVGLARRFEDAWREGSSAGRRPDLRSYLAEVGENPGARLALLRADMGLRHESGERVSPGWYQRNIPDLGEETFVALIYEEFCLREEADETPDSAEYLARYPEVAPALRRVLDIHGLVGSGDVSTTTHGGGSPGVPFPEAGETIGGFRLVEELGRGAFARVFLAQERQLADRPVALKVARVGTREPQTLARLQHTHIVPVHSYRTDPATGLHLLCMPYFGRVTLARVLADPKVRVARTGAELLEAVDRLGSSETPTGRSAGRAALARRTYAQAIAWWGARMAEALDHAHDRGVLHRDVKPSNVLVSGDGMPMLLDFNLAREAPSEGEDDRSVAGGTLDYMAPEHLEELADGVSHNVDVRSDVFGLGVLLYESLMGVRPYQAPRGSASAGEMLLRAAEDRRKDPPRLRATRPDIPPALESVVRRCLAPEPSQRYATAAELAVDLQAVADDRSLRYAPEPLAGRAVRWVRRRRRTLAMALPIVLALLAVGAVVAQKQLEDGRHLAQVKRFYDAGVASDRAGDLGGAIVQFESATRLIDNPGGDGRTGKMAGEAGHAALTASSLWPGLDELRLQTQTAFEVVRLKAETRAAADALSRAADPLRFRLTGFGGDRAAAYRELEAVLRPFHVLDAAGWQTRPDLSLLDDARHVTLLREVNELLYLWAVALDHAGDPTSLRRGVEVCDLALAFVPSGEPWRALRERLAARRDGAEPKAGIGPRAVKSDESSPLVCFQWGALRLLNRERGEALAWFKKAVRLDEGNYWFHFYLAYANESPGGVRAEAFRHFDTAVALKPSSPWVRFSRARLYREAASWALAMEDLRRALAEYYALDEADRDRPLEDKIRLELGLTRQSLGDLAGARAEYQAVIAANPQGEYARAARQNRAKLDADAGDSRAALAEFDALLAERPGDPTARLARALVALRAGDPARAESDLTELLSLKLGTADRAEALGHRALARLIRGRASEAASDASEGLTLAPSPRLERILTRCRIALGRANELDLARPEDLAMLPLNGAPLRADLWRLVDRLRKASGAARDGVSALRNRITLVVALTALGDPSAEDEAHRAVVLAPLAPRPYLTRARVYRQTNRLAMARQDVDSALRLAPDDPRTWELRGEILVRSGDAAGGLADLDRAIALGAEGAVRGARAEALAALHNDPAAIRDWTSALQRDPDDPRAYLGRAESYLNLRQWDPALADLEEASAWSDGRPGLNLRIILAYARALPQRPEQISRLLSVARRALSASNHGLSIRGF